MKTQSAICNLQDNNVPIELVELGNVNLPIDDLIVQQAKKLEHCKYVLKIDLYNNGKDLAYIPVFILEDLYESIRCCLNLLVKINTSLTTIADADRELFYLRHKAQTAYSKNKDFFKEENTMFNYIKDELINYLYNQKLYRAASDLVRLLLLVLKPGCYIDIEDMNMKRVPLRSDFTEIDILTRGGENYLIFCVKAQNIADILTYMYIKIRKHMVTMPLEHEWWLGGDNFVNYMAGFNFWGKIMHMNYLYTIRLTGKIDYATTLIEQIAVPSVTVYNSSGKLTVSRRAAFLANNLLGNKLFEYIVSKEIQELDQHKIEELKEAGIMLCNQSGKLKVSMP